MKNTLIAYVGWLLLGSALFFYGYGIIQAIILSWSDSPIGENAYPEILSATISSIQALLLANLGIILGIAIAKPDSALARQVMLRNSEPATKAIVSPLDLREKVQLVAVVLYILSLIACFIAWINNSLSSDSKQVVFIISESGKMFTGVVLAYVTAVLSH